MRFPASLRLATSPQRRAGWLCSSSGTPLQVEGKGRVQDHCSFSSARSSSGLPPGPRPAERTAAAGGCRSASTFRACAGSIHRPRRLSGDNGGTLHVYFDLEPITVRSKVQHGILHWPPDLVLRNTPRDQDGGCRRYVQFGCHRGSTIAASMYSTAEEIRTLQCFASHSYRDPVSRSSPLAASRTGTAVVPATRRRSRSVDRRPSAGVETGKRSSRPDVERSDDVRGSTDFADEPCGV